MNQYSDEEMIKQSHYFMVLADNSYFQEADQMGKVYNQILLAKKHKKPFRMILAEGTKVPDWFKHDVEDYKELVVPSLKTAAQSMKSMTREQMDEFFVNLNIQPPIMQKKPEKETFTDHITLRFTDIHARDAIVQYAETLRENGQIDKCNEIYDKVRAEQIKEGDTND